MENNFSSDIEKAKSIMQDVLDTLTDHIGTATITAEGKIGVFIRRKYTEDLVFSYTYSVDFILKTNKIFIIQQIGSDVIGKVEKYDTYN